MGKTRCEQGKSYDEANPQEGQCMQGPVLSAAAAPWAPYGNAAFFRENANSAGMVVGAPRMPWDQRPSTARQGEVIDAKSAEGAGALRNVGKIGKSIGGDGLQSTPGVNLGLRAFQHYTGDARTGQTRETHAMGSLAKAAASESVGPALKAGFKAAPQLASPISRATSGRPANAIGALDGLLPKDNPLRLLTSPVANTDPATSTQKGLHAAIDMGQCGLTWLTQGDDSLYRCGEAVQKNALDNKYGTAARSLTDLAMLASGDKKHADSLVSNRAASGGDGLERAGGSCLADSLASSFLGIDRPDGLERHGPVGPQSVGGQFAKDWGEVKDEVSRDARAYSHQRVSPTACRGGNGLANAYGCFAGDSLAQTFLGVDRPDGHQRQGAGVGGRNSIAGQLGDDWGEVKDSAALEVNQFARWSLDNKAERGDKGLLALTSNIVGDSLSPIDRPDGLEHQGPAEDRSLWGQFKSGWGETFDELKMGLGVAPAQPKAQAQPKPFSILDDSGEGQLG